MNILIPWMLLAIAALGIAVYGKYGWRKKSVREMDKENRDERAGEKPEGMTPHTRGRE